MSARIFLVTRVHGGRWDETLRLEEQENWEAHAKFMDSLYAEGVVALAGPIVDTTKVMLVVRAENETQVKERLSKDPWVRRDILRTREIQMWELRLGSLS